MALSDKTRYNLKLKALKMLYNDNCTLSEIASALNISRVTLNKLIEEAKSDGMVRIEVVDVRNTGKNFSTEIELYKKFNLKNVILTDCSGLDVEGTNAKIARNAAEVLDRYITSKMTIGTTWGNTIKNITTMVSERQNLKGVTVCSLVGATNNPNISFQPTIVAQKLAEKLHATLKINTAPFLCSSASLCSQLKKEPHIASILNSVSTNDINLVGIGTTPDYGLTSPDGMPYTQKTIDELKAAGAVGDIGGVFYDIEGKTCKVNFNSRIVTINLNDLKKHNMVIAAAGGKGKEKAILGALKGGFIDILITDLQTANRVLDLYEEKE